MYFCFVRPPTVNERYLYSVLSLYFHVILPPMPLLNPFPSGFCPSHSPETLSPDFHDRGQFSLLLLLNFAATYDIVDPVHLLENIFLLTSVIPPSPDFSRVSLAHSFLVFFASFSCYPILKCWCSLGLYLS